VRRHAASDPGRREEEVRESLGERRPLAKEIQSTGDSAAPERARAGREPVPLRLRVVVEEGKKDAASPAILVTESGGYKLIP